MEQLTPHCSTCFWLLPSLVLAAGEDETEQLLCIMEILGTPPGHLVDSASRRKTFFDSSNAPIVVPNSRGKAMSVYVYVPGFCASWPCCGQSRQQIKECCSCVTGWSGSNAR